MIVQDKTRLTAGLGTRHPFGVPTGYAEAVASAPSGSE